MPNYNNDVDSYFSKLEKDKAKTQNTYTHIVNTIDYALKNSDTNQLLSIIPFIETGDGQLAFQYIGITHRILRILHIIFLENKYHCRSLKDNISSFNALYEKYMFILFSLRRLSFHLSDSSEKEALDYLQTNPISPFALLIIIKDELIPTNMNIYHTVKKLYSNIWTDEERNLI